MLVKRIHVKTIAAISWLAEEIAINANTPGLPGKRKRGHYIPAAIKAAPSKSWVISPSSFLLRQHQYKDSREA